MNQCTKGLISFVLVISMLTNSFYYCIPTVEAKETAGIDICEDEVKPKPVTKSIVLTDAFKREEPVEIIDEPDPLAMEHTYTECLTKRGGIYYNPYTGLKETWYSQRVLPGGGLDIPGRHVNEEGIVCDMDGYICVASSTYSKGTVVETSRGMAKVYDCGCAPGVIDIYTDW